LPVYVPRCPGRGELHKSISCTHCEDVHCNKPVTIYSADVVDQFPHDLLLQELGVCSHVGAPLFSPESELLGILAFMSDRPIEITAVFTSVFEFLATCAGMELTREELKKN